MHVNCTQIHIWTSTELVFEKLQTGPVLGELDSNQICVIFQI